MEWSGGVEEGGREGGEKKVSEASDRTCVQRRMLEDEERGDRMRGEKKEGVVKKEGDKTSKLIGCSRSIPRAALEIESTGETSVGPPV